MRNIEIQMNNAISDSKNWKLANTEVTFDRESGHSRVYLHGNHIATVGDNFVTITDGVRITGVSVSRANGEGSQITVRGFGPEFNLVTLNGRQMSGTGFSRSFNFENLSSEGVSALEVYKTARADVPTGGLGATVNIVTTKPLQSPGQKFSLMTKGIYDSSNETGEDVTPEVAGVYSNTFHDDRIGVSANFSYQRRDFQRQSANIRSWQLNPNLSDSAVVTDGRAQDVDGNVITIKPR